MTDQQQHHQLPQWDLVVQRGVVDVDFRARLVASPQDALREMCLPADGLNVIVQEVTDRDRIILLPPLITAVQQTAARADDVRPYSDEPQSQPILGTACCALSNPTDPRATYGIEARHG